MLYNKLINTGLAFAIILGVSGIKNIDAYAVTVPENFSIENISISGKEKSEAKRTLEDYIQDIKTKNASINFNNATLSANLEKLGGKIENENELLESLDTVTSGNVINRFKVSKDLEKEPRNMAANVNIDKETLQKEIEDKFGSLESTAVDAKIKREGNSFTVTEGKNGVAIDVDTTLKNVENYFISTDSDENIELSATVTEPRVKKSDLDNIKDILGTYTTDFSSSSAGRATNIRVGTEKINGSVLLPGETLSGYTCMSPFSTSNGYEIAHAYENGRVVDSVGGGACQIATTLYNASLRAEVGITERKNHSMTVGYVPASADAAIAGTYKDIKITNNYSYPIYVEGVVSGRKLTFNIWGKEERNPNRKIEFVSEILSTTPAGVTYKDDPTLPTGTNVTESKGHDGRKSKLWKVITVNGVQTDKQLISNDSYMMSNDIVRRGVGEVQAVSETPTETANEAQKPAENTEAPTENIEAPAPVEALVGPGV